MTALASAPSLPVLRAGLVELGRQTWRIMEREKTRKTNGLPKWPLMPGTHRGASRSRPRARITNKIVTSDTSHVPCLGLYAGDERAKWKMRHLLCHGKRVVSA